MPSPPSRPERPTTLKHSRNTILRALSPEEEAALRPHLAWVDIPYGTVLYPAGEPIRHVHFLEHGCSSVITSLPDGSAMEVGTIGNEGMVGVPVLLEADRATSDCEMQIPGAGWRATSSALKAATHACEPLRVRLLRFAQAHFNQVAQSAACNRLHPLEQRCARWLLMTRDRTGDSFPLTHEYLAIMLGVRRAGVTVALGALQKAGLVGAARGQVTILDPVGLEAGCCPCYRMVRDEFERLGGTFDPM